jgi:BolA protein
MSQARIDKMRAKLSSALEPVALEIRDDSAMHVGHAGARGGAGHYTVSVTAGAFKGLGRLQRHRLVYDAIAEMMPQEVHALSINATAPDEDRDHSPTHS